ncbi:MAG: helicase associated domain-containing protein, partial [Lachnospiraceae bacterium]|nr:helicase associated domain-containing protein [Lachnospiraceae bacterium]
EYYAEHKNLEVPAAYATEDGYSLGAWVATQRKIYTGKTAGRLSAEQIRRLEGIGMRWQGTQALAWEKNFAEAESYFKEHGDLKVPADFVTGNGCKLGRWLRRQRELYQKMLDSENAGGNKKPRSPNRFPATPKRQSLHAEHIKKLAGIGMVWQTTDSWERRFALAKEYYEEHGNLRMPADYVVEGVWLDRWLREQKARWEAEAPNAENGNKPEEASCKKPEGDLHGIQTGQTSHRQLTQEQKEKLSSIGLTPGVSQAELSWREQYGQAEEFFREHGNLSVPKRYMAGNGKNLGAWLQHQRAGRKNGRLSTWQVGMLDEIGMVWEARDAWEQGIAHAQEYRRENGDLEVPNAYISPDGYRLGKWISNQRCAYAGITKKPLTLEQVQQLEGIGMVWNVGQGRRAKRNA